jgi:hypothetical protein
MTCGPETLWSQAIQTCAHEANVECNTDTKPDDSEPICLGVEEDEVRTRRTRAINVQEHKLWEFGDNNKLVPYVFDKSLNAVDKMVMKEAMNYISSLSCVKFQERPKKAVQKEFLTIKRDKNLKFQGSHVISIAGKDVVTLATNAMLHSNNIRSRGHIVLGHVHTQKRHDRDTYITIYPKNINMSHLEQYDQCSVSECLTFQTPYDCMSIMHYRDNDFAINNKPTMAGTGVSKCDLKSKNRYMTWSDIDLLNKNYGCSDAEIPFVASVSYRKMNKGQLCSGSFLPVVTESDCKAASQKLGLTFKGRTNQKKIGLDCLSANNKVYFNTNPNPSKTKIDSKLSAICRRNSGVLKSTRGFGKMIDN